MLSMFKSRKQLSSSLLHRGGGGGRSLEKMLAAGAYIGVCLGLGFFSALHLLGLKTPLKTIDFIDPRGGG